MVVTTEKIISVIKDNSNLPFYVFVDGNEIDFYAYSSVLQQIDYIDIDYITRCPELDDSRIYVKSWDDESMAEEFYERMSDIDFEMIGSKAAWQTCIDKVESLNWEKCILAYTSMPV